MALVNIGFVGVGGIAQAHLNNLKEMDDVAITAMTDVDENRLEEACAAYGATGYRSVDQMFGEANFDAVYICVPPFAHGPAEKAALERGIPMYVEKPLSVDAGLPEEIGAEIRRTGLIAAVGFQLRYISTAQRLRDALAGRTLGLVRGVYACPLVQTPWWKKQELSGGQLVEQAIHVVDLIRFLTQDEVSTVFSKAETRVHTQVPDLDIADVTATTLTFESGAVGSLTNTCALPGGFTLELDIVADGLRGRWTMNQLELVDTAGSNVYESDGTSPMALADRAFVDAVIKGSDEGLLSTYEDALKTHRVVMAALKSAQQGEEVRLAIDGGNGQ